MQKILGGGYKITQKSAFTLVEMSVVIVIIAIMLSTVLISRMLITSARINAVYREIVDFTALTTLFTNEFGCSPGDCSLQLLPPKIIDKTPSGCFNLSTTTGMGNAATAGNSAGTTTALSTKFIKDLSSGGVIDSNAKRTCAFYQMQAFEPSGFGGPSTAKKHDFNSILGVQSANAIGASVLKLITPPIATSTETSTAANIASASYDAGTFNGTPGYLRPGIAAYFYNVCYDGNGDRIGACVANSTTTHQSITRNGSTIWSYAYSNANNGGGRVQLPNNADGTLGLSNAYDNSSYLLKPSSLCASGQIDLCAGTIYDSSTLQQAPYDAMAAIAAVVKKSPGFVSTNNITTDLNSQVTNYTTRVGGALNALIDDSLWGQTNPLVNALKNYAMWDMRTVGSMTATGFYPFEAKNIPAVQSKLLFIARDLSTNYIGAELTGANTATVTADIPAFSSAFALKLDQKYDDGKPYSGNIIAGQNISDNTAANGKGCTNMTTAFASMTATDLTASYNSTTNLTNGCIVAAVING
jgi:prepilin-type N-terminal cleavage/methylation domain-containing protein